MELKDSEQVPHDKHDELFKLCWKPFSLILLPCFSFLKVQLKKEPCDIIRPKGYEQFLFNMRKEIL